MKLTEIKYENDVTPVPKEIIDYCMNHYEEYKEIPLNAETCKEIAKIIDDSAESQI